MGKPMQTCPLCGGSCQAAGPVEKSRPKNFFAQLPSSLIYPLNGRGKFIILGGTAAFTILELLPSVLSIIGLIVGMLLFAYTVMYLLSVISSTANNEDEPPDWPDIMSVDDTVGPLMLFIGTILISFGPAIVYRSGHYLNLMWVPTWEVSPTVLWVLTAVGAVYLPMAMVTVAIFSSIAALNPFRVISAIFRVFPVYAVALAGIFIVAVLAIIVDNYLRYVPVVGIAAMLYFSLVEMRILGLIYSTQAQRLGWFPDK